MSARPTYKRNWNAATQDSTSLVLSGNAYYKITPAFTGTLTVNPDFANTPLDTRQVNTTRFNLFQPETREFFLQDASAFEYGGRQYANAGGISGTSNSGLGSNIDNGRPFFSRNFGLANGLPVNLVGGVKLSGPLAGLGIGALSALADGTGLTRERQVLSVARITKNILESSKLGVIVTQGDPTGATRNMLGGADFQYRDSNFFPGQIFTSDAFYQHSHYSSRKTPNLTRDDDSFGIAADYPNEPLLLSMRYKQIGKDFAPALGYLNRSGIREYVASSRYRNRKWGYRWVDAQVESVLITGLDNQVQSAENSISGGINDNTSDMYYVRILHYYENIAQTFNLPNRVPVRRGEYQWVNINPSFALSNGRPYSVRFEVFCCKFYDGDYVKTDLSLDYRPIPLIQFQPRYIYTYIHLPTGHVEIHVASMDLGINFTPNMQLFIQTQFDNISGNLGVSARYRWEYEPGQEIFASLGHSTVLPGDAGYERGGFLIHDYFVPQALQVAVRLGHTFRF